MSETARSNRDLLKNQDFEEDQDGDDQVEKVASVWYVVTESILVVAAVPSVVFFVLGVVNGLLLLIQQDEHAKWVVIKKFAAVSAGKSASSVSDHMEDHLTGSTTVLWVLLVIYTQILFTISKKVYPYSGLAYLICLFGGLIYHIIGIIWVADEDCTDTDWYKLGLANTIIFFFFFIVIVLGALIWFFIGNSNTNSQKVKPQARANNVEESDENILPRKETEKEDWDDNKKQEDADDKKNEEKKDEEYDLEEEEIY